MALCIVAAWVGAASWQNDADLTVSPAPRGGAAPAGGGAHRPDLGRRESERPNVVVITTDDMRADDLAFMPHTRRLLGERGVTFTDGISPYSLCCPSRATLLTGQYSHNNGVRGNFWPNGGYWRLSRPEQTLPAWLQGAGYNTGFVGKYLNAYAQKPDWDPSALTERDEIEVPPGWTHWYGAARRVYAYRGVDLWVKTPRSRPHWWHADRYQTTLFTELANRMISEYSRDDRPFFIWLSHLAPHFGAIGRGQIVPPQPEPADRQPLGAIPLPNTPIFQQRINEDTCDKGGRAHCRPPVDRTSAQRLYQRRIESLQSVDRGVKRVIEKLKATGEYDDTVIIFTSDNGYSIGEHRFKGKDMPYDISLRVPMIVSAPGIAERYDQSGDPSRVRSVDGMVHAHYTVTTQDIAATVLSLAQAKHPGRRLDGIDMMDPHENPDHLGDRAVLIESGPRGLRYLPRNSQFIGVRTDRWTWFGWHAKSPEPDARDQTALSFGMRELYDRRRQPAQVDNVLYGGSRRRVHVDVARRLHALTRQMWDCNGQSGGARTDSCVRSWESSP